MVKTVKITDYEYAVKIYCVVFKVESDNFDCNPGGVFAALETLTEREQEALKYSYRMDFTLKETGEMLGLTTRERPRQIIIKALRKLRHPARKRNMSIAEIKKERDYHKENCVKADSEIDELKKYIGKLGELLPCGLPNPVELEKIVSHYSYIEDLDLSVRTFNCLKRAGYKIVMDILEIEAVDDLRKIRNIGKKSCDEIIDVMKMYGFTEWALKMRGAGNESK